MGSLEGAAAVEVVGVDDGEGTVDLVGCAEHGVAGAPGLGAAFGNGVALGQLIQGLIGVDQIDEGRDPVADGGAEVGLHLGLDDAHDLAEAGADSVKDREVDDDVTGVVHGRDLLVAAETAAETGGHDDQSRLIHDGITPYDFLRWFNHIVH